jgi:hypothetical protein
MRSHTATVAHAAMSNMANAYSDFTIMDAAELRWKRTNEEDISSSQQT